MSLQDEIDEYLIDTYDAGYCDYDRDRFASVEIINKVLDAAIESVEHKYRYTVSEYDSGIFDAIKSIQALKVN